MCSAGIGGRGSEGIRMAEVIHPCSKEQSVRTIRRIGVYLLLLAPEASRPLPRSICGRPVQPPCEAHADGDGVVGENVSAKS
ncbi:hypothetical protein [Methanocalculus sp.]|uniref:hypothetical protein n=1 Tax=Methanocalculus sp. TaxID=2004547 RepID=UPI00263340F0|nr:hypothetical protein [Methanocalculus sp.]MDG6250773.1 hypothetical protein [Methanocalculus sp.]